MTRRHAASSIATVTAPPPDRRRVRDASPADAAACADIYAPYVRDTCVSFEARPPGAAEMAERIAAAQQQHAWLVLEQDGQVVGYAYGGPFKARDAYRFACEVSVYLEQNSRGTGGGRTLYEALFARLRQRGYRTLAAGMTVPNDASAALHRSLGFTLVGTWRRVGWKQGAWRDVTWFQLDLDGGELTAPTELV